MPAALDALPTFIYVKDRDLRVVSANLPFCRALGVTREQLIGKRTDPFLGAEGPLSARIDHEVIETGTSRLGIVEKYMAPDGLHWLLTDKTPIKDNSGVTVGLVGTTVDITARKWAEDALERSESQLRFLTDSMADMLWTMDLNLATTYISPSVERLLGFTAGEWMAKRVEEMATAESVSRIYAELQQQLALESSGAADPNRTLTLEVEFCHKNGSTLWIEQVIRALRDDAGRLVGMIGVSRDVSARKRAEKALAQSEAQLRFLADHMADMLWTMDLSLHTTYVSPSVERVLGFTPEERKRQSLEEMVTPDSARRTMETLAEQLRLEQAGTVDPNRPVVVEVEYYHKDGSATWFENVMTAVRDAEGALVGLLGVSRDVSERRQAESALKASEERYRQLFDESIAPISLIAPDGRMIESNDAWFRLFGYSRADMDSFRSWDIYPTRALRDDSVHRLVKGGRLLDDEARVKTKNGTLIDVLRSMVVRHNPDGSVLGYQTVWRDITEQKRARQALKESEEKYRQLFNQSVAPVSLAAPDGRIIEANEAWFDLFGYSREDLPWLTTYVLYDDPRDRDRTIQRTLEAGQLVDDASRHKKKDGSHIDVLRSVGIVRDSGGKTTGFLAVYRDVTELKRAQDELLASREQLRELAARMQQVLERERTTVAHDLHDRVTQGLTALKLDLDTLKRRPGAADPEVQQKLQQSIEMVEGLTATSRDIMTELRPGMLDDLGLCAAVDWQIGQFSQRTGIACSAALLRDDSTISPVQATALFRVLQELLANVARHAQATKVAVMLERHDGNLVLTVSDNGLGISEQQVSNSASLGLLGIHERVRALGGDFSVHPARDAGTIARVRLPSDSGATVTQWPPASQV